MRSAVTLIAASTPSFLASSRRDSFDVGDDDEAGADVAGDRGRHQADRPGAGDQHVLADERERQGGVHGVAQRVEHRGEVGVHALRVLPHVGLGDHDVLRERAVPVDADARGVDAQVPSARAAVAAVAADHVPLAGDHGTDRDRAHGGAHLDDVAGELVPRNHGRVDGARRPAVPRLDVQVGAADAGPRDADLHVVRSRRGLRTLGQGEPGASSAFVQSFHSGLLPSGVLHGRGAPDVRRAPAVARRH